MSMHPTARKQLATAVRSLRAALLRDAPEPAAYTLLQRAVVRRMLAAAGSSTPDAALAEDLPGLFGPAPDLPAALERRVADTLADPDLAACWTDDLTPGWAHQYWNDPEREALDARLHARGKLAAHEIARKTQLFSEPYLIKWLLHNSLGPLWLAICARNGWTPEVVADGTWTVLETRRAAWRAARAAGEVAATDAMPLHGEHERDWAHYLEQPLPADAPAHAPASVRDLKILDPAVGAGHFLILAFGPLQRLYREEARHRGRTDDPAWSEPAIARHIIEHNLHGLDIDPRAVQIAAVALWLRARRAAPDARPRRHNLATPADLGPTTDPADLRHALEGAGVPPPRVAPLLRTLAAAEHLGSLLRLEPAIAAALEDPTDASISRVLDALARALDARPPRADLGLALPDARCAGARYLHTLRESTYDLVIGNPPYQATARLRDAAYFKSTYPRGRADLYAAFLERGLQLARPGGTSALLTMRGWMFAQQYADLRAWLLRTHDLRALGDFAVGAFEDVPNDVLSVVASVFRRAPPDPSPAAALLPSPPEDRSYDRERTRRKRAAAIAHLGRHSFSTAALSIVPGWPIVHWWPDDLLRAYDNTALLGATAPARKGLCTNDDERFLRKVHEVSPAAVHAARTHEPPSPATAWVPAIRGGKGRRWFEPLTDVIRWHHGGLELQLWIEAYRARSPGQYIRNPDHYFRPGVAFSAIGADFGARAHRYRSVFGNMGPSLFPADIPATLCSLNSARSRAILQSLNPGVHFEVGDVNRLPQVPVPDADHIYKVLERAFTEHEAHRPASPEFRRPGPSPWRHAQAWAQSAVDRPHHSPLPPYTPHHDPEPADDHLTFALAVALGRLAPDGAGLLDPTRDDLGHALPAGLLFLDTTLAPDDLRDGLGHPAARPLLDAWTRHCAPPTTSSLRDHLARDVFAAHRRAHDNRPIFWPLASRRRTFTVWLSIHRLDPATLHILVADHLRPALARHDRARAELATFIAAIEQCATAGPPPPDPTCPPRERDAAYAPDLDDGVALNAAALWPLFPQWKDPERWWRELAAAAPGKDRDWSRLAMRHWPTRVDHKCRHDPSLALAHRRLFRYHPARAWAWELRQQDEHGPTFRMDGPELDATLHRAAFLRDHPTEALQILEHEALRRLRRRGPLPAFTLPGPTLLISHRDECRALEARITARQGAPFRLRPPASDPGE